MRILVGTDDGLHEFDTGGRPGPHQHTGRAVTALGAEYPRVWMVLYRSQVWRTDDEGGWDHQARSRVPDHGVAAFATSDGRVFASDDEGASWAEVSSGLPRSDASS